MSVFAFEAEAEMPELTLTMPEAIIDFRTYGDAFVNRLPAESKQALIASLMRDVIRVSGGRSLVPVTAPDGQALGYFVPPSIAEEQSKHLKAYLTEEHMARWNAAMATPEETFDARAYLKQLAEEDRD